MAQDANAAGLSPQEAAARLQRDGPNEIRREVRRTRLSVLAEQFKAPVIWLLLGACVLSGALGEVADAIAIGAIVVLNAAVGFVQEYRAERALDALRKMTAPRARVLRGGHAALIAAREVVEGDLLLLEAGDLVAADARVLEANLLQANEAPLTGESTPVGKRAEAVPAGTALAERSDSVFMGTAISRGTGLAQVGATGMRTELGRIAELITTAQETETPLQVRLAQVTRTLVYACLGIVAVVAALGVVRGVPPLDLLLSAVSLAVAAVPEGLPAVVTIALAVGVQRMAARHVLVRRLHAVETLGTATVICTDKTGTLTQGEMAVREVWGKDPRRVLEAAAACCDADLDETGKAGTGDPTEVAILVAARQRGISRGELERSRPRVEVTPFDSDRKRMSILRADGVLYVKGAVDLLAPLCSSGLEGALESNRALADRGLRVLAVAAGRGREERDLELLGLVGIADPPRPEAVEALAKARGAGVKTVMITGDHPATARAIAAEMRLVLPGEDPAELVHARATAEDKLRIVRALKGRGEVVAMTGDGVNDAPALREAHIGVAMGRTGTEVTREAADMVLADDNYASLVAAIREGRAIYENIRKTLVYLLSGNGSELWLMLAASAVGLPLPLIPIQLLWINLVTDSLPALALVIDPPASDLLERPPRPPSEAMLGRPQWLQVAFTVAIEGTSVLAAFFFELRASGDLVRARSVAFTALVLTEVVRAFAARSPTRTFWEVGVLTNLQLLGVVVITALLQFALVQVPALASLFQLEGLRPADLGVVAAVAIVPVSALELWKLARRAWGRHSV